MAVTLLIEQFLQIREKRSMARRLNMIIGDFFSEVGSKLLGYLSDLDPNIESLRMLLFQDQNWTDSFVSRTMKTLKRRKQHLKCVSGDLADLREFLLNNRHYLLHIIENKNLLEHDTFTELVWAVFHLAEEVRHRKTTMAITDADRLHLDGDVNHAYKLLVMYWLTHMNHLRIHYPYLFALALDLNPFLTHSTWGIKEIKD
jgi:hypothetical protein